MIRSTVKSSNCREIGHDKETNTLEVQFHAKACVVRITGICNCTGGDVFHYLDVKPEEHSMLMHAPSVGSHFRKHIVPSKATRKNPSPEKPIVSLAVK